MKTKDDQELIRTLLKKIKLREEHREHSTIVVGLSGGADSMVLSELLYLSGYRLVLAHCNFALRGDESDRDEAFVRDVVAQRWPKATLLVRQMKTKGYALEHRLSIEMAARELRYSWFSELSNQYDAPIAVGHHRNDQIETVLLNIIRGTGGEGLTGMERFTNNIWRPLLELTRSEIEQIAAHYHIPYVVDSTNLEDDFTRNKIRHQLIPLLESINPSFIDSFARSIDIFKEEQRVINRTMDSFLSERYNKQKRLYDLSGLEPRGDSLLFMYRALSSQGFSYQQVVDMLAPSENSRRLFHGKLDVDAERFKKKLFLFNSNRKIEKLQISLSSLPKQIETYIGTISFTITDKQELGTLSLDYDQLEGSTLQLVTNLPMKTAFRPFGMKRGRKEIGTYLKECSIPSSYRQEVPVLLSNGEIAALLPLQIAEPYRITPTTQRILQIKFLPNEEEPLASILDAQKKK